MVKVLHTADIHIGASFAAFGRKAADHRDVLRRTFKRVIELSIEEKCDVMIVAGDLFDRPYGVAEKDISFVIGELSRASGLSGIVILPGSHDYWARGSVFEANAGRFEGLPNLRILKPGVETIRFDELSLAVHGRALQSNVSNEDPLAGLKADPSCRFNIAVAHGSVTEAMKPLEHVDIPVSLDGFEGGFDYLALGHWHSFRDLSTERFKVAYSGSPELVARDQEGSGYVVLVELGDGPARFTEKKVGMIGLKRVDVDCSGIKSTEELVSEVERAAGPDPSVVISLNLTGFLSIDSTVDFDEALLRLEDSYHSVVLSGKLPQVEIPREVIEGVPESTVAGRFIRVLLERIESSDEEKRRVYEEALQIGYQLFRGKNPLS